MTWPLIGTGPTQLRVFRVVMCEAAANTATASSIRELWLRIVQHIQPQLDFGTRSNTEHRRRRMASTRVKGSESMVTRAREGGGGARLGGT